MSRRFSRLPSELLDIEDEYTAFCFDEACAYVMHKLESGSELAAVAEAESEERHYSRLSDMYKDLGFAKATDK